MIFRMKMMNDDGNYDDNDDDGRNDDNKNYGAGGGASFLASSQRTSPRLYTSARFHESKCWQQQERNLN